MDESNLRYEGWRVAAASGVSVFLASMFIYTFAIFLKPLSEEFSWSREAVSSAYGITAVVAALCAPPLGYLFDRWGPRLVVVPFLILYAVTFASLTLLTAHVWHLYAVFAVLGMVGIGMSPMAYSRAVSSWFDERRGTALAIVVSGGAIGAIVHPPLGQGLVDAVGWRSACLILGALVLAIGLPTIVRFVRERPALLSPASARNVHAEGISVRDGLSSRVFWILVIVLFYSSIAQNAAIVHLSALLTDRGVSPGNAALAVSAMGAASLVGRLLTGSLLDRFFGPRVSFVLLVVVALGTFLLSSAQSFASGALAAALIGFGMGGESDVTPYLLSRYFGLRSFSTLYGFTWTATSCAGAIGPILMGRTFDTTGSYETLLVTLAGGTLAVAALMFLMPRYTTSTLAQTP